MGTPVVVEVLAPGLGAPVVRGLPRWENGSGSPLPSRSRAYELYRMLDTLRQRFDAQVVVHVLEPFSVAWMLRVLRFRPRGYPAFIVGGRAVVVGLDEAALLRAVGSCLRARWASRR
ncbi:MAG: hypothetical protein QN157_11730 [Armatimonadota bacterium]|nr:hypothetical protein [Armatimonadota bacterium]